ncbi:MAG: ClpXP protease specificity-enhancing factor SspB [Pontixanthobacter sp.]
MTENTPDSLIPYDDIVQEALRAVVGRVLGEIVDGGGELPGNHHFYITFKTHAPDVNIPKVLRERFPDEMTIVLQNKFWDLAVDENGFTVGLSFNAVPSKLDIPYAAITAFVDPAVDFGLQFQASVADMAPAPHDDAQNDGRDNVQFDGTADTERSAPSSVGKSEDGSNVVTVDFGKKG